MNSMAITGLLYLASICFFICGVYVFEFTRKSTAKNKAVQNNEAVFVKKPAAVIAITTAGIQTNWRREK